MAERKNSEKRIATNNRWTNAHYDRINIAVPKGRKDEIKALAEIRGQSVNAYIISAVDEKMDRDGGGVASSSPPQAAELTAGSGVVYLPPDTLEAAQGAAGRTGETVSAFVARAVAEQRKRDDKAFKLGINPA